LPGPQTGEARCTDRFPPLVDIEAAGQATGAAARCHRLRGGKSFQKPRDRFCWRM